MKTVLPLLAEYLGTFLLVLGMLTLTNPIFLGLVYTVIVFLTLPVSGACINPAVVLGMYLKGKLGMKESILYVIIQLFAAFSSFYIFKLVTI
jgi:glycerol uptake facilitator-like aquaporin